MGYHDGGSQRSLHTTYISQHQWNITPRCRWTNTVIGHPRYSTDVYIGGYIYIGSYTMLQDQEITKISKLYTYKKVKHENICQRK